MSLYSFSWKKSKNFVELDNDVLKVVLKPNGYYPQREYLIPAHALRGILFRQKNFLFTRWDELILWYEESPGKNSQVFLSADPGNNEIRTLADELGRLFPQADRRQIPPREVLKQMPIRWWQPQIFVWPLLALLVISLYFLPQLIHSFDRGNQTIQAEAVIGGIKPQTHNLTILGKVLDSGLREKTGTGYRKRIRQYFPLVPFTWKPGEAIFILIETPDFNSEERISLLKQTAFKGIWRNVLWEGPRTGQISYLQKKYGLLFSPKPMLFELNADKDRELTLFLILLGLFGLVLLVCFLSVWVFYKR
jgi:hypothetical protein